MTAPLPDPATRRLITAAALAAVMMIALDGTIAVIALPRIQSNLAASQEQIAWVLTSYLIAAAISTPLSGWLADRFGRVRIMALSVVGFTLASLGCGLSANLEMLVVFRFLQGITGASLVPLSQVLLLDINPEEKQGSAIAMFGLGTLLGPMLGPTLGGWLTEYFSWRWIFLINLPVGVLAFFGLTFFAKDTQKATPRRFDAKGFIAVALALTSLQLMLDRGQMRDWFSSPEICLEAALAATAFYMAVVHMLTTRTPFIKPAIFRDRNFMIGNVIGALIGVFLIGVVPIVTNLMQQLLGYPVILTAILSIPRALGNILTMVAIGRLVTRSNARMMILIGIALQLVGLYILGTMSLDMGQTQLAVVAFVQGAGAGFLLLPLTLTIYSTLPSHFRNEAATLFALTRNLGGAIGISVIEAMTIRDMAGVQSHLVEKLRIDNPVMAWRMPDFNPFEPGTVGALMGQLMRQVQMVAYVNSFRLLFVLALVMAPLCLLLKPARHSTGPVPVVHLD